MQQYEGATWDFNAVSDTWLFLERYRLCLAKARRHAIGNLLHGVAMRRIVLGSGWNNMVAAYLSSVMHAATQQRDVGFQCTL